MNIPEQKKTTDAFQLINFYWTVNQMHFYDLISLKSNQEISIIDLPVIISTKSKPKHKF